MPDKDILDNLRYISELHRNLHQQRRTIELRVVLTTLTLYGLATMAALKGEFNRGVNTVVLGIIAFCIVMVAFFAIFYLLSIHKSNRININFAEAAEKEIMNQVSSGDLINVFSDIKQQKHLNTLPLLWQSVIIFFVAVGSAFIIYFSLII
jgi:hypothetical protein